MSENPSIENIQNLLTVVKPAGKALTLKAGSIVKAQVIDITDKGEAVLRLAPTGSGKGTIIRAYPEVPLIKGQNIFLEILGGKNNLTMKFIGESARMPETPQQSTSLKTVLKFTGKALTLKAGSIIKAYVMDMTDKGEAVLRIVSTGSGKGTIIKAYPKVPLTKGQNIFFEILGGKNNLTMRLIGESGRMPEAPQQSTPGKLLDMLARLSVSRPGNSDFQQLQNMLKSLPQNIKTAIPEFRGLEKLLMDIKQIDGKILKAFIETSGVAFENRLRIAVFQDPVSMLQSLMALQTEGDLKSLLMKLKTLLKNRGIINTLKQAGYNITDISGSVDRFINNIEFFQLTSKLNDMFYTFLPVVWDDLKDGEFLFKKNRDSSRESYTCDINLDLESLGKLSISVTISDDSFFITFLTEKNEVKELIRSNKHLLEDRFESLGFPLKAVYCNYKKNITFGKPPAEGTNVKI